MVFQPLIWMPAGMAANHSSLAGIPWETLGVLSMLYLVPIPPLLRGERRRVLAKHEFHPDGTPFQTLTWPPPAQPQPSHPHS